MKHWQGKGPVKDGCKDVGYFKGMAKLSYLTATTMGVCTLLVLADATLPVDVGESTQTLAQRETLDTSVCYMRLADGRLMDLRGICGKAARDRPSAVPVKPSPSPLDDDDDESTITGPTPSASKPTPVAPTPTPVTPTPVTPTPVITPVSPSPSNTPGTGQPTPATLPVPTPTGAPASPTLTQPGVAPANSQPVVPSTPHDRDD